jgi:hypothetical protein
MRTIILIALSGLFAGCARHEFDLLEPPELAQRIGREMPAVIERAPLVYRLQSAEGRLVMTIRNPTDQPVVLLGERSYVVDPEGQSRPLPTQAIAPASYIKLIFPPLRDPRAAPRFGIGFGVMRTGTMRMDDEPVLLSAGRADPYWRWRDEAPVRMRLVFQVGADTFAQDFVFRRVRV